ncbi:hypothetical protein [Endozoicomonas sp. SESOKO1]|uniref:hypothetical protein n=1 Tax=Endozoicomonas sp. SESOKO1 TaxID=2828742 RepID=UPI0021478A40|nr:hypothetical protein [Endozoicomonas sp. SESOKO1]
MNILPKPVQPICLQTQDVATQTETGSINHLGREVKLAAPQHLYNGHWPHHRTKVCREELSRKITIIHTNASLINFPLIENTLLDKYGLSECVSSGQGKRLIAECALATAINVQMPTSKMTGRLEGGELQYLGDCINSLQTLMAEGWNKEASTCLKKNLLYETKRITIPGENLVTDRKEAINTYILENQSLFVDDAAVEKTTQALSLFRHQLAYQNTLGLYPRTPRLFDLSSPQTIIGIEANRTIPGDEPRVQERRAKLQAKMALALAQMTDPDSRLVNMILNDQRAAGILADGDKQILRTALTRHHANIPIPAPIACLFYLQLTYEFWNSLADFGLDPEAMLFMIDSCQSAHSFVGPNQKSQQVMISWESLRNARLQSAKARSELPGRHTPVEEDEWIKECVRQLTYVPNTNFFRMLNTPSYRQKLGITPRYAPEYYRKNDLSGASESNVNSSDVARKRLATTNNTVPQSGKVARPAE